MSTSSLTHPQFKRLLDEASPASDRIWLLALTIGIATTLIAAYFFPYPASPSGKFWAYAGLLLRSGLYLSAKETLRGRGGELLYRLFLLGLVAGSFELLVDWGLIHWVSRGQLVYLSGNDVVLLGSPVWMPLAWACVIVELGYPALRLFGLFERKMEGRNAAVLASLFVGLGAGVTVGFYEYFAFKAGWWKYLPARAMLGDFCALYIPLGEFFMFLFILPIAARALRESDRPLSAALAGGFRFALAIAGGYTAAYFLLESGS